MKKLIEDGFNWEGEDQIWDLHQYVGGELFVYIDNIMTMEDPNWLKNEKQLVEI